MLLIKNFWSVQFAINVINDLFKVIERYFNVYTQFNKSVFKKIEIWKNCKKLLVINYKSKNREGFWKEFLTTIRNVNY